MPSAATTQSSSAVSTVGQPMSLAYGLVWATGRRESYFTLQETGIRSLDFTRVGFWRLGLDEWDGPSELWINNLLAWAGSNQSGSGWLGWDWIKTLDYPNHDFVFHWHAGCDAPIGSGLTPQSNGPDQLCDRLWSVFPPAVQPLCWNRTAYYGLMRKQPILYQQNNNDEDPSQWDDINPIGLFRARKCRIFDGDGAVVGYAFTRNPIWHWIDVKLRCELFQDYNLPYGMAPDPPPPSVSSRFNWGVLYDSAVYCNQLLSSGQPRFTGDYFFASQTTVQAITATILRCCRGFEQESQGKLGVVVDRPRPRVFSISRGNVVPHSLQTSDTQLQTAGNRYLAKFRNLLVPACNSILSIDNPGQGDPTVTTDTIPATGQPQSHPFNVGDRIAIGGTGTVYDGEWVVSTVPDIINPGTPEEIDPTTFTITRKGWNYPTHVGAAGSCGLLYSRFNERTVEFNHHQNQLARGVLGVGIDRRRTKVNVNLDFSNSTYDQVARIVSYERDRSLGFDTTPYVPAARLTVKTSFFAKDPASGNVAAGAEAGDRIAIDDTASFTYQGDYEVIDPLTKTPPQCAVTGQGGSLVRPPDANSGQIEFSLQTYDERYFYDYIDPASDPEPSVPGSLPGDNGAFSAVPLANGGNFVFFTGQLQSGYQFQLPSTGYPSQNMLAWASPAGANIQFHSACYVQLCDVDSNRALSLLYADASGTPPWGGDVNFACLTWLSPDVTNTDANGMTWLPLTLLGGEQILVGRGVLENGSTIQLPAGWNTAQCRASAFIHDQTPTDDIMYLCGAWVDNDLGVHCATQDHSGNTSYGNATVLVFAWKNNMGTVTSQTLGGATWLKFPLSDGSTFGVGFAKEVANGATLQLPDTAGLTLQPMLGPGDSFVTSGGGHAQGVGACYLDSNDVVNCSFNDGSGDTWYGTAGIFATYATAAVAGPSIMRVTPQSSTIAAASTQSFSAALNASAADVTWSVDGVVGGNVTVGTIDAFGNYGAPNIGGTHTITATSVPDPSISGSAVVTVVGTVLTGITAVVDEKGNYIAIGDDVMSLE